MKRVFVSVPVVTVLEFDKSKIIKHTDYAAYDNYKQQISLQIDK